MTSWLKFALHDPHLPFTSLSYRRGDSVDNPRAWEKDTGRGALSIDAVDGQRVAVNLHQRLGNG